MSIVSIVVQFSQSALQRLYIYFHFPSHSVWQWHHNFEFWSTMQFDRFNHHFSHDYNFHPKNRNPSWKHISMCNVCTISGCIRRVFIVCCSFSKNAMTFGISKRFLFKHWIKIFFSELWFITSTEWKYMVRWCGSSIGKL